MYNLELKDLSCENFYSSTLAALEFLCDEFHLEDYLGTFSASFGALNSMLFQDNCFEEVDINFYIESCSLSFIISSDRDFSNFCTSIQTSSSDANNYSSYVLSKLLDAYDLKSGGTEFYGEFHVKPHISSCNESSSQQNQKVNINHYLD